MQLNNRVDTAEYSHAMRRAAFRVLGPDAHAKLWTNEQTFAVCRECGFNVYTMSPRRVVDFVAAAVCINGRIAIYHNAALCVSMVRIYVLGELAVAMAMRDHAERCAEFPEYTAAVGAAMRIRVEQAAALMEQLTGAEGAAATPA